MEIHLWRRYDAHSAPRKAQSQSAKLYMFTLSVHDAYQHEVLPSDGQPDGQKHTTQHSHKAETLAHAACY